MTIVTWAVHNLKHVYFYCPLSLEENIISSLHESVTNIGEELFEISAENKPISFLAFARV